MSDDTQYGPVHWHSNTEMPKDDLEMIVFSLDLEARMRYAMADAMLRERERKSS
jgi:hypothetical protein